MITSEKEINQIIEYSEDGNIITELWIAENGRTELKRNVIDLTLEFTKPCRD